MTLISTEGERKNLNIVRNAMNSKLAGMAVLFVRKAWDVLSKSCLLEPLRVVIQKFLWFYPAV